MWSVREGNQATQAISQSTLKSGHLPKAKARPQASRKWTQASESRWHWISLKTRKNRRKSGTSNWKRYWKG